ncbi:MAG: undecaprenyl-phosphate glucose phosphotransferase [Chloroflexi bacterium]|nr:undecaprenyl-phosphate glucose phosphotransferase [Chloroflexota bacterium]
MRRTTALFTLLTIVVDAIATALAFYSAYQMRVHIPFPTPIKLGPFHSYWQLLAIQVGSIVSIFFLMRLYHTPRGRSRIDLFYNITAAASVGALLSIALTYLFYQSQSDLTRGMILYSWVLTIIFVSLGRLLTQYLQRLVRQRNPDRMLLVGTDEVARMILQRTRNSLKLGYKVVGFVNGQEGEGEIDGLPVLGPRSELRQIIREHQVQEVVLTLTNVSHEEQLEMIAACTSEHAAVRIFPDIFQIVASDLSIDDLDGLPLLSVRDISLRGWRLATKRIFDIWFASHTLVFISPLMLVVAALIKLDSKGPVFYTQTRVGLDGKPFPMIKFRSMRADAEDETGPVWTKEGDPRRTRLGAFLRKTSLDELPQFINVLLGDMSVVGPRPERPVFVEQFKQVIPRYSERHREKAGITGWAQVNGLRGNTSIEERTQYDLYYIENWSILFDIKIIFRTILRLLRGDHSAY